MQTKVWELELKNQHHSNRKYMSEGIVCMSWIFWVLFENAHELKPHHWKPPHKSRTWCIMNWSILYDGDWVNGCCSTIGCSLLHGMSSVNSRPYLQIVFVRVDAFWWFSPITLLKAGSWVIKPASQIKWTECFTIIGFRP